MANFKIGDYIFTTENAHTHRLQIGKVVAEYYGSQTDASYYSIMFGDSEIKNFSMVNIDDKVKFLRAKDD